MTRTISVVTTFHKKGYEDYGSKMIDTFLANWPKTVKLFVYAENCQVTQSAENLTVFDLHQVSEKLMCFKNKWRNEPKANGDIRNVPRLSNRKDSHKPFKWDAVRFSHKVYSIFHCATVCNTYLLLWMDADMICHSSISHQQIDNMCNPDADLCFLGRKGKFSECGLYSMNLTSSATQLFLEKFQWMYDHAEDGIFLQQEWHDSFIFDVVRTQIQLKEVDWSSHLITGEGHPLINSIWGAYLDHLKGKRKEYGKSLTTDLKIKRTEGYWQ
jgi:hypothetical protein